MDLHADIDPETSAMIQQEAIEVFTAMVNRRTQLSALRLQAVFLSGMNAAREGDAMKPHGARRQRTTRTLS